MRKLIIVCLLFFSPAVFAESSGGNDFGWYGLIPALLAIVLAILSKQVVASLLVGIASGTFILSFAEKSNSFLFGIDKLFDHYLLNSLSDKDHASVILFSLLIAAGIHVISKMGAFNGLVIWLSKYAKSKRSALLITYFMGFIVFFDDYANTLVVGNTMRKITDKFKISREKLAFIVDATAAPVASIAIVSTWIGYEVQLIGEAINEYNYPGIESGFMVFLNSISYSFYPLVILVFIFVLILSKKDFGPMLKFEKAVVIEESTELNREHSIDAIWAIIPIALLLFVTILGIYLTGSRGGGFVQAIQTGNCYTGLIWGSAAFLLISVLISFFAKNKLSSILEWVFDGMKSLFSALTVLVLAWALTAVLKDLQLGLYLGELMVLSNIPFVFIPIITFILATIIAFSTGSSFSTMGILVPIVVTVCISFYSSNSFELSVFYASIASVLSGAVLGDHCSPISDTTILSSMATGCNHINHVNSQLTYCLLCGGLAVLLILLNVWVGLNLLFSYIVGVLLIYLIINVLGKDS